MKKDFESEIGEFVRIDVSEHLTLIKTVYDSEDDLKAVIGVKDYYHQRWDIPVIFHEKELMIYLDSGHHLDANSENLHKYLFLEAISLIYDNKELNSL